MTAASIEGSPSGEPSVFVRDFKGREIAVGTKVIYGDPVGPDETANQTAEVIEIEAPDIDYFEDEYGRDVPLGVSVTIAIKFSNGEIVKVNASFIEFDGEKETFEEAGDIEVKPETEDDNG